MKAKYLTVAEAATLVGLSARRIRVLAATGRLGASRHGRAWLIPPTALDGLETHGPGGRPAAPKNNLKKSKKTA